MHVHPGEIDSNLAGDLIKFSTGRRPRIGPAPFVPALADNHPAVAMGCGVRAHRLQDILTTPRVMQVESCDHLSGLDDMQVRVDKGRRDQSAIKINFSSARREGASSRLRTDEPD